MSCAVNSLLIPIQLCGGKKTKHPRYNNVSRVFLSFSLAFNTIPHYCYYRIRDFSEYQASGESTNKKVNPFLNKRVRQVCAILSSLARGRENRECVLVMGANRESAGLEKGQRKNG